MTRAATSRSGFLGASQPGFVPRVLIPAAIVLFWGGMVTHLVSRQIVPDYLDSQYRLVDPEVLFGQWQPIQEWAWIEHHGNRVGATGLVIDKRSETPIDNRLPGYVLTQHTHVDVTLPGATPIPVVARIRIHLSPEFHVEAFAAEVTGHGLGLRTEGFVENGRVYYRLVDAERAGEDEARDSWVYGYVDVGKGPLDLSEAVKPLKARHGSTRVGDSYKIRVFNPFGDLAPREVEVRVAGQETLYVDGQPISTFRLETALPGMPPRKSWVDLTGATLRRDLVLGYAAQRGGAASIRETYPDLSLSASLRIPIFAKRDFIRRAQAAGAAASPGGVSSLGLLGNFVQSL